MSNNIYMLNNVTKGKEKTKHTLWETICNMFYYESKWQDITYLNEVSKLLK